MIWKTRRGTIHLAQRAQVMGILNMTPDSFSDGGRHAGIEDALSHARQMIEEGATILDIGGESTRPGAPEVSAEIEIARVVPVIRALRNEWDGLISVDTSKAAVAAVALDAGADMINDVSGLCADKEMMSVCIASGCGVVIMHMKGSPRTMQVAPHYEDVIAEVGAFFQKRLKHLVAAGMDEETVCFDPGIGFGKNLEHNLALLRALNQFTAAGRPLLLGVSRKSFMGKVLDVQDLVCREWPTVAITAWAREQGVMLHRVHAVRPNVEALRMTEAILGIQD